MVSAGFEGATAGTDLPLAATTTTALKIALVGPLGVGKTTFVTSVSEITPLTTEEAMSKAAADVDAPAGLPGTKTTTTVAMDFGRISLSDRLVLYLFEALRFDHFFLQPMDGPDREANTRAAVAYCLAHPRWRLSLQTHKLLGIP